MIGLYRVQGGALLSVGTVLPDPLPEGTATLALPEGAVYGVTHTWDAATPAWVSVVVAPDTRLTVTQFRERFTDAERDRIELAQHEHPDALVRARLRRAEKELASVQGQMADRAHPGLQRAVAWMTTVEIDGVPLIADMTRAVAIIGADAFDAANLVAP